jgi:hypothetical protein
MTAGAIRQALPTVTGFAVKSAIAALRQRSTDPRPLLHRAGLAEGDLDTSQRRLAATRPRSSGGRRQGAGAELENACPEAR